MIDLTGKSVFVRTQEEYSKVLRIVFLILSAITEAKSARARAFPGRG